VTRADHERHRVIIEISDTGAGISPENISRIFDPFFTTKAVGVGTGLGLAISQRIIADADGELTVRSVLGQGTTFFIALPIAKLATLAVASTAPADAAGERGRVLVIDDEELVLRSIHRALREEHDIVSLTAATDAVVRIMAGERFDLILCDLMMPDMTGMDLYRELLQIAPDQAERMIFLTGGAFTPNARRFVSESGNEHLEKPFSPSNLRAIVQRFLRSRLSPQTDRR
jgi:CheY-like chemotaxis protein